MRDDPNLNSYICHHRIIFGRLACSHWLLMIDMIKITVSISSQQHISQQVPYIPFCIISQKIITKHSTVQRIILRQKKYLWEESPLLYSKISLCIAVTRAKWEHICSQVYWEKIYKYSPLVFLSWLYRTIQSNHKPFIAHLACILWFQTEYLHYNIQLATVQMVPGVLWVKNVLGHYVGATLWHYRKKETKIWSETSYMLVDPNGRNMPWSPCTVIVSNNRSSLMFTVQYSTLTSDNINSWLNFSVFI